MERMKITSGHQVVMPHLTVTGAADFIDFTRRVFKAELTAKVMRDESLIMHGEISIGGSTVMFADATEAFPPQTGALYVYVPDTDETYRTAIEEAGAISLMAPFDESYGARAAGFRDPFGNSWWIATLK